jgi:hypothetical protein
MKKGKSSRDGEGWDAYRPRGKESQGSRSKRRYHQYRSLDAYTRTGDYESQEYDSDSDFGWRREQGR